MNLGKRWYCKMQSVIPPGDPERIVIAGKSQGWLGLAIHFGQCEDTNHPGVIFPTMETAWQPDADELARLNAGAAVVVRQLGTPPIRPMSVYVGEAPDAP
jgi:hypothetical protein